LLRKQRKTLGGYFFLPHPVDSGVVAEREQGGAIARTPKFWTVANSWKTFLSKNFWLKTLDFRES